MWYAFDLPINHSSLINRHSRYHQIQQSGLTFVKNRITLTETLFAYLVKTANNVNAGGAIGCSEGE